MSTVAWQLRQGVIWKATPDGSRLYDPPQRRSWVLDPAATCALLTVGRAQTPDLPGVLNSLTQQGWLVPATTEGCSPQMNQAEPRLDYVVLRVTNACNLRCQHCFVASGRPESDELTLSEIARLFEALTIFEPQVVVLTGGEPLLRRDLFEIATLAQQQNLAVDVSTNGTLAKGERLDRLAGLPNLRYIILSLEGPTAELHDEVRGAGNFALTVNLMRELTGRGVAVSINHCVTARNLAHLTHTIDLALALGATSIHLAAVSEAGRACEHWDEFALTPQQRQTVSLIALQAFLKTGRVLAGEAEREVSGALEPPREMANCGVGQDWCMIYANGDVAPCRPVYTAAGAAGNIRIQSFETIWRESPLLTQLRAIHDEDIPRCRACAWRARCHGGCRARAYQATGSWLAAESEAHCHTYGDLNRQVNRLLRLTPTALATTHSIGLAEQPRDPVSLGG